jgi:hypothetical protein
MRHMSNPPDHEKATEAILTYLTTLDTDAERLDTIHAIAAEVCLECGRCEHPCDCMNELGHAPGPLTTILLRNARSQDEMLRGLKAMDDRMRAITGIRIGEFIPDRTPK